MEPTHGAYKDTRSVTRFRLPKCPQNQDTLVYGRFWKAFTVKITSMLATSIYDFLYYCTFIRVIRTRKWR